ncbi:right-handed parallel beta-helix repeat-containing protein [Motilibacter peucedani]|uniref:right-handed parallel beta-helix repeat-containing protein n=1 Tax=Motilibacter peucedani TaxID=598650 RepID=UPI0016019DA9|nr:right-handed parallel beta-helix repeat-containing protein [Motilibacter peucedani]
MPVVAALGLVAPGAAQAAASCTPDVGGTGLSASVVAHDHQRISRTTVDATGCDIGIYVGAGADHVTIRGVRVTGAGYQGIFAEKVSHLRISDSTVTGNAYKTVDPSAPPLPGSGVRSFVGQAFAISLFGVSHVTVQGNKVYDNGRGGIGVMDNGPFDPGARMEKQNPAAPLVKTSWVKVVDNDTWGNYNGCGVVAATQNVDGALSHITIRDNRITGIGFGAAGPDIGGIVVAADLPGSTVTRADVAGNTVRDSFEGGLIVNSEAPGSSTTGVYLYDNQVSGNNVGFLEAPNTAGVITFAAPGAANNDTRIFRNTITDQFFGVWSRGDHPPTLSANTIAVTAGGVPVSLG